MRYSSYGICFNRAFSTITLSGTDTSQREITLTGKDLPPFSLEDTLGEENPLTIVQISYQISTTREVMLSAKADSLCKIAVLSIHPCPAEPRYTLPLQTV